MAPSWIRHNYKRLQEEFQSNKAHKPRAKKMIKKWVVKKSPKGAPRDQHFIWRIKETHRNGMEVKKARAKVHQNRGRSFLKTNDIG
jgi:hypothetical protein